MNYGQWIRFLNVKNIKPADIQCQIYEIYGETIDSILLGDGCVFFLGRTNVHAEERIGRPSVVNVGG